jgi:hypothetical protein
MYRPNFCAECGTRIIREHWRIWHSRKFCSECAKKLLRARLLFPIAASLALLGIGQAVGRLTQWTRPAPHVIIERTQPSSIAHNMTSTASQPNAADAMAARSDTDTHGEPHNAASRGQTEGDEIVQICGARTRKGTPCARRVRGNVRCWQHKGLAAMIPLKKRMLTGK